MHVMYTSYAIFTSFLSKKIDQLALRDCQFKSTLMMMMMMMMMMIYSYISFSPWEHNL